MRVRRGVMPEESSEKKKGQENIITPEEFEELEKKETKKKFLGSVRKGKEEKPEKAKEKPEPEPKERVSVDKLTLKVEKLEGKMESLEELRHAIDERFSRLSEEIGELRSSILERDRSFDKVEAGFKAMEEIVEELEPTKLRKELDKKSEEIVKNQARIEALGAQIKEMSKSIKDMRDLLAKIKDVKNLVSISNEMGRTLTKVEKERRTITKTSGKIETIFSELSKKISEFDSYKDKVDFNAETMHDLMKAIDMLEVKLEGVLKKEDMEKIDDRIKKIEIGYKDDVQDIKDIVSMLVSSLKRTSLKDVIEKQGIESVSGINERVSDLQRRMEAIEDLRESMEVMGNDVEVLKSGMDYMRTKAKAVEKEREEVVVEDRRAEESRRDALGEMIKYVRECMDSGYTTKQVKKELLGRGWPRKAINEVILREVIKRRKEARAKKASGIGKPEMKEMLVSPKY